MQFLQDKIGKVLPRLEQADQKRKKNNAESKSYW